MTKCEKFGEFCRGKRLEQKLSLRKFCQEHHFDSSFVSKLERGRLNFHTYCEGRDGLEDRYMEALDIKPETGLAVTYGMLFHSCDGEEIPKLTDEEIAKKLPIFIHKGDGTKLKEIELDKFVEDFKEMYNED